VKIEALERELPPAMLLLGPDLDPMVLAVLEAVRRQGGGPADTMFVRRLTAENARRAVNFSQIAPFGPFKAIIIVLYGASAQAQNILLKVLEEPPPTVRFILVATSRPLPTIVSRCQVITVPGETASPEADQKVTAQVAAALNAANAGDLRGLDTALSGWGALQHAALEVRLTGASLSAEDARESWEARRMLGALGRFAGANPRLAAHAALISVLGDKEHHA
jgi:hypothetical protein